MVCAAQATPEHSQVLVTGVIDIDFLAWLAGVVSQASRSAEVHSALRITANTLAADIERQFKLSNIIVRPADHDLPGCPACSSLQHQHVFHTPAHNILIYTDDGTANIGLLLSLTNVPT